MIGSVYLVYELVRGLVSGSRPAALRHADQLVHLERALGIFGEEWVQRQCTRSAVVATVLAVLYPLLHLGLTSAALVWFHRHRPEVYVLLRTAVVVSSLVALVVFAAYPVAPPRLAVPGIDDVVSSDSPFDLTSPLISVFYNPFAALPSIHVAYAILVGAAALSLARPSMRIAGLVYPWLATLVVAATGNHFFLDAVAGAAVALVAGAVAWLLVAQPLTTPSGRSCATRRARPARSTTSTTRSTSL